MGEPHSDLLLGARDPQKSRYELLFAIASGGMGTVYAGRRLGAQGFTRIVAIKRMHRSLLADPRCVRAFREEAEIASHLQHANVVSIHDVHEQDDELFLVMDFIDGASFAQLLSALRTKGKRLAWDVALRVVYDALCGLHAAHELTDRDGRSVELVHRDATPQNILIGQDGSVRLTDFGIARAFSEQAAHPGYAKGKIAYMAPEHAFGEPLDRRADIFSMGVVLWEALTGRRLFSRADVRRVAKGVALGKIPRPSSVGVELPPGLDEAVLRALAPWPEDRYPTAQAFADALDAVAVQRDGFPPSHIVADALEFSCGEMLADRAERLRTVLRERAPSLSGSSSIRRRVLTPDGRLSSVEVQPDGRRALRSDARSEPAIAKMTTRRVNARRALEAEEPPVARDAPRVPAPPLTRAPATEADEPAPPVARPISVGARPTSSLHPLAMWALMVCVAIVSFLLGRATV